jgi:hypothetical protein
VFNPISNSVVAPVRVNGKWSLAEDGRIIWDRRFVQLWHSIYSPDGSKLAAIVAPKYGKWTVAVDGHPWPITFNDMVADAVFSPDSKKIAAVAKKDACWFVAVDGVVWKSTFDMAWKPVFSSDSNYVALKFEKNGKYGIALNDQLWDGECDEIWDPVFSPAGDTILVRALKDGTYSRHVLSVTDMLH